MTNESPFVTTRTLTIYGLTARQARTHWVQRVSTATDRQSCLNFERDIRRSRHLWRSDGQTSRRRGKRNFPPDWTRLFLRDYVRRGFLCKDKTYPQGGRGVVLRTHKFLWRETHVDLRLPDGKFLLEVPIDYVRTLD